MKRGVGTAILALLLAACARDAVGPDEALSVSLDSLPFPAVVGGDSLRDTAGVVRPLVAQAFNFRGEPLPAPAFRYFAVDRGVTVDSISGIVRGDSLRETPVRVVAALGQLQTQTRQLAVVPRPDSLAVVVGLDTLRYTLLDTTANVSQSLDVRLLHLAAAEARVRSWIVGFSIVHPADTLLAVLVSEAGTASRVDTTGADGLAGRRIRLRAERLVSPQDSVVVLASARYRGLHVRGSPARLVVHLRPLTP